MRFKQGKSVDLDARREFSPSDHGEGLVGAEEGASFEQSDGLFAGVDQIGVDLVLEWVRALKEGTAQLSNLALSASTLRWSRSLPNRGYRSHFGERRAC